jgi:hypothetical protein
MSIPFSYNLPDMTSFYHVRRGRLEDEHKSIFHTAEEMLTKYILTNFTSCYSSGYFRFGLPGKPCVLRLICELAESRGLVNTGLLGKALQTIFL